MSKKILTPEDLRKIAERIDEEEAAEKENAHERDRLKTEAARLKVEREKIRAEYERERLEHARNTSNADERESRRRFIVALFYGGIVAAFLIWSIIIVTRYF